MTYTYRFTIILLVIAIFRITGPVYAQDPDELLLRDYVNPDEIVSIAPDTPFGQAIQILSDFTQEYDNRIIIDRSGYEGPINVNINNIYWRRALQLIARVNNLLIERDQEAYEIRPLVAAPDETVEDTPRRPTDLPANLHSREVEISAIFFEGNRRTLRELGVDWSAVTTDGRVAVNNIGAAQVSDEIFTVGTNFTAGEFPNIDITALFNALESANQGEILSSPRVKVVEGREGRIQVGQDISIKQRDIAGNVIDQFIDTGTILRVTPLIISEDGIDFIYLNIAAERSSGTPDPVSTIITKQEAQSELLLLPGETAVIAGLYETEKSTVRRGIPFLKDLPGWFFGLKYIFGYNSTEIIQNELVVVLKADIVPSLQQRAQMRFRSMPEMLDEGRRNIILDREIGSAPRDPVGDDDNDQWRSAPPRPVTPIMLEEEYNEEESPSEPESNPASSSQITSVSVPANAPDSGHASAGEQETATAAEPETATATEPERGRIPAPAPEAHNSSTEEADTDRFGLRGAENETMHGAYTIVLHSLPNESRSRIEKRNLQEQGYKTTLWQVELPDGRQTWRTGVGQFPTVAEARAAAAELPEPYLNNHFIVRIR